MVARLRRRVRAIRGRSGARDGASTARTWTLARERLPIDAFLVAGLVLVSLRFLAVAPWDQSTLDLHAYWATRFGIDYGASDPFRIGAYLYAPIFAQVIAPLTALPWPIFAGVWTAAIVAVYVWLVGRWAVPLLLTVVVGLELFLGQIDIFLAAAIVLGFRYPVAWAFPLLTKVTPGVGLLWFAVRREWRSLLVALSFTAAIAAVSAIVAPAAWRGWFDLLVRSALHPESFSGAYLPIPLLVRLPIAAALVAWGARTDRSWTVPVAATIAMPVLWFNVFTILVGVVPLRAEAGSVPARRWLLRIPRPRASLWEGG